MWTTSTGSEEYKWGTNGPGDGYNTEPRKYIDIRRGFWCCKRMEVLAKYHDYMDVWNGKVSVYAPEDSFWHRQINQEYFKFDFCPYCAKRLFTSQ